MKKNILMKSAAIAALFSLVALLGCNNNAASASNSGVSGAVFGYVTDTKGAPLEGVSVALGDKIVTTNANGAFALTGVPVNATQGTNGLTYATSTTQTYTLTVKKDGYLPATITGIAVVETTDKSDAALLLNAAASAYQTILDDFAKLGGTNPSAVTASNVTATDGVLLSTQNTNDTFKGMADAYATILDRYQQLSKETESTFVSAALKPCNGYFEGTLKITKSPAKNITTDASSIKPAKEGVKLKLVSAATGNNTSYVYEATTDKDGKFKFEKLPVATTLTLKVEGFEDTYETGEGENKVTETYYYSLVDGFATGTTAQLYDGNELQEDTLSITLDENSGAKYKADILLYSQPAKIIVTATNLLQNTEVAPLALNTPVTVTFNKPMDYVKLVSETGVTTVGELGEKAAYAWDDKKTTVTITPKDGYWTASSDTVTFKLEGRAQDGATTFIDNKFTVKLDNVIKVVFADTSSAAADSFTLTFDRELVKTDVVKVTDDKSEALTLTWDKTNAAAPVLTVKARDGKFATTGDHTFTITGVEAKDQSTVLYSYNREFTATTTSFTFKTRFDGFKATAIEVVDKFEGALSRAVVATTAQYLKITFNKNVDDVKNLTVSDVVPTGATGTANTAKYKYVKDNAVYVSLANFEDDRAITISGSVTSTSGDVFTGGTGSEVTWTDLLAGYKVRTAYVIAASSLYTEKESINDGNNNTVSKIKKGDTVTLTFNKEIPTGAVITTELYDTISENLDETALKATAVAAGKVVTVTLDSKVKINTTYYLSLKIKSSDGAELFSTGSKSFGTGTAVKDLYIEPSICHTVPSGTNAGKKYIKIVIDEIKLLTTSSSKTTKVADFAKTSKGTIVLQFNQDVTGYKAFLYKNTSRDAVAKDFVNLSNSDKANFYAATASVDKDTITITPTYSFPSEDEPGIAVYNADGEWFELATANGSTIPAYKPYKAKKYAEKLEPENATEALAIDANKKAAFVPGTDTLKFSFDMPRNTYSSTLPTFTLYKKVDLGYGDKEWTKNTIAYTATKEDGTAYTFADAKANTKAWITVATADVPDFTYGTTTDYVLLATVNNMVIKSNVVTINK